MTALLLKKFVTLLAIVEPFGMIPLFLQATEGLAMSAQRRYARLVAITVTVALLAAGLFGAGILDTLGISLGGMRVGGGIIVLMLAIAMVLGQEKLVKQTQAEATAAADREGYGVVPLGIPLLAGPAALSYVMTHGALAHVADFVGVIVPVLVVGLVTWAVFHFASRMQHWLTPAMLNVIERLVGFLLAGLAVDMMATGLRELFPILAGAS